MSFNPHTHAGCDYLLLKYLYYCQSFNPHTHAGCDSAISLIRYRIMSFNPHTHAGCDYLLLKYLYYCQSFNPHTHAGCDRNAPLRTPPTVGFNPHTHAGCDKGFTLQLFRRTVSIHTPTQGVTKIVENRTVCFQFQSTHPRRV